MRKLNDSYEVVESEEEAKTLAKKHNITIDYFFDGEFDFYSPTVTIGGQVPPDFKKYRQDQYLWQGITVSSRRTPESCRKMWKDVLEEIPGLFCPNCNSQGFKTDHPGIAVCGACPGWYFWFKRIDQDLESTAKLVIKNGELVEATETDKGEGDIL